jgi:uncharacterized protein YhaN
MYLSGFHIDGFGIYHDQGVQDLPPGLVLFVGDNESGKTTLMEFLRTLLFGFPRRAAKRNDYDPWRGGNHGGRLQVVLHDGRRYTIERAGRHPATLTQAGGTTMQAEPALHLLGGLDRDTFKHVFAVGLEELQGLGVLSQEGVRGRLFAAGTGLGRASVPEVMKNLDKELTNLLALRGQKQIVNLLVKELKETESRIRELQGQAAAYAEGRRQQEHLEARVGANLQESEARRRELGRVERLEQARVPWANRNRAREQAVALEYAQNFPVNGLDRLEALQKELDTNRQDRQQREGESTRLAEQLGRLTPDAAVLAHQEAIEALAGERAHLAAALNDYPGAKSDLDQAQTEFARKLRELGPAWDGPRLAEADTSVQVRQRVAEFARQLGTAERRHEMARAQERALAEAAANAEKQAEAAAQQLKDLPAPPLTDQQELARQQETVRRLRAWLHQREILGEKLRGRESARDEAGARAATLQGQLAAPAAVLSGWLGLPWLLIGLGLGVFFLWRREYLTGGLILGAGLVLAGIFFWVSRWQAAREGQRRAAFEQELAQVEENREGLASAITELTGQIAAAAAEIARAAQVMDREPPGDLMVLEEIAGELEQAAAQLRDWQGKEQDQRQAGDQLAQARARLGKAQAETALAAQDFKRFQDEWTGWLVQRGFSDPVRPEGFEAVLQAVENARAAARVLDSQSRRVEQMSEYLFGARGRIAQGLMAWGRTPLGAEPGVEDLDALRRALAVALTTSQQRRELTDKLAAVTQALDLLKSRGRELAREVDDLLRQAGAADAEDFRRRGEAHGKWRELVHQMETEETALYRVAGTREAQAALEEELGRTDPLELQEEKERLQARVQELSHLISADDQEIGDLKGKLKSMEQDEQLSDLLLQQRTVKEQLADATRRWATLVICRHLVDEARGVYERERQPQVIQEADHFLHTMAHGRYRLLAAVGEDGVHLESLRSQARKEEVAWSAGLADQVYLAIRLGLAREFGRHSEPLPVILDDVLVKFDPSRRVNTARVILEFAREQQVLLFSCHPEIMDIMAAVRRDPRYQETPVAGFAIADGVISRGTAGLDGV